MNAIPETELHGLYRAINAAIYLAWNGRVGEGFRTLLEGRRRAEWLAAEQAPWAEDLARRYRNAAACFAERYGERLLGAEGKEQRSEGKGPDPNTLTPPTP